MSSEQQKLYMDEALLQEPAAAKEREGAWPSLLTIIGFGFLTFNSAMAVYQANTRWGAISFVAFSYLDLVALFYCLRWYQMSPKESPRREHLKMAVWLLTTMLTFAVFMLLEVWFSNTGDIAAKSGTVPQLQHPSVP